MTRILLTLALVLGLASHAQEFAVGARAGFNTTSIGDINSRGSSIQGNPPDVLYSPTQDIGFQLGAYLSVEFGKFFLRPEINYMKSKNHYDFVDKTANWEQSQIEVPLLAGYTIFDPVSIYAGPAFNFYSDAKLDGVQVTSFSDGGPDLEKNTMSFTMGVLVRWKRFAVDLRYEKGLKENEEELLDIIRSEYGVNLADRLAYKTDVLSLSFMIDIFRTNPDDIGGFFSGLFRSNKCYCPY